MKAQISRVSHQANAQYNSVLQQQGRMITDADWNELVAIIKARQELSSNITLASGVPKENGVLHIEDTRTSPGIVDVTVTLQWGNLVVDGIIAEVLPTDSAILDFDYNSQLLFPQAPELPEAGVTFYADVWERLITSIQDSELRDPALHGADTCARTQLMAQIKYTENPDKITNNSLNPSHGNAEFDLIKATNTSDINDPCLVPTSINKTLGNYLFRLEVHKVEGDVSNPSKVFLKWSSENAAESHIVGDAPVEFEYGDWNYEFFDKVSEQHLGVHLDEQAITESVFLNDAGYPTSIPTYDNDDEYPYVRRWDGYCILQRSGSEWSLLQGKHLGQDITSELNTTMTLGGDLTIRLGELEMKLACASKAFVAGDYWLSLLREAPELAGVPKVLSAIPIGIVHHYIKLVAVNASQDVIENQLSPADVRKLSFPALTNMNAERIGYNPTLTTERWVDINESSEHLPYTVQDAIDQLADNLEASDIIYEFTNECGNTTYDVKSFKSHLREDMGSVTDDNKTKIKDLWDTLLCVLDANHIPYNPQLQDERWEDINDDPNINLPSTVQEAIDQLAANLEASDISYQFRDDCTEHPDYSVESLNTKIRVDLGKTDPNSTTKIKDLWDKLLCVLDANHIPYNPTIKEDRWNDINEFSEDLPTTVQQAIDDLLENLESSDINYLLPACTANSVRRRLNTLSGMSDETEIKINALLDALLCELDASTIPYDINSGTGSLIDGFLNKEGAQTITGPLTIDDGVATPEKETLLDVKGTVKTKGFKLTSGDQINKYVLTYDSATNSGMWKQASAGHGWSVAGNIIYADIEGNTNVRVGINDKTPQNRLQLGGGNFAIGDNTHRMGKIRLWQEEKNNDEYVSHAIGTEIFHNTYGAGSNYKNSIGHKFYRGGGEVIAQIGFGGNGNPANRLNSYFSGKVGINDSTPSYQLDVNGTARVQALRIGNQAAENYFMRKTDFRVTRGEKATTARNTGALYDDFNYNYADVTPPYGFTMSHLMGFIASSSIILFAGDVDGNDILWCRYQVRSDRIRVICANSENRQFSNGSASYITYMAIWRK